MTELDRERNAVIVGTMKNTKASTFTIGNVNWIGTPIQTSEEAEVKIRYLHPAARASVTPEKSGRLRISFLTPQHAVTPGQSAVLYRGEYVLGGGMIEKVDR